MRMIAIALATLLASVGSPALAKTKYVAKCNLVASEEKFTPDRLTQFGNETSVKDLAEGLNRLPVYRYDFLNRMPCRTIDVEAALRRLNPGKESFGPDELFVLPVAPPMALAEAQPPLVLMSASNPALLRERLDLKKQMVQELRSRTSLDSEEAKLLRRLLSEIRQLEKQLGQFERRLNDTETSLGKKASVDWVNQKFTSFKTEILNQDELFPALGLKKGDEIATKAELDEATSDARWAFWMSFAALVISAVFAVLLIIDYIKAKKGDPL